MPTPDHAPSLWFSLPSIQVYSPVSYLCHLPIATQEHQLLTSPFLPSPPPVVPDSPETTDASSLMRSPAYTSRPFISPLPTQNLQYFPSVLTQTDPQESIISLIPGKSCFLCTEKFSNIFSLYPHLPGHLPHATLHSDRHKCLHILPNILGNTTSP